MFLIVEGIDRVGKTTLCQCLNKLGFITLKDAFNEQLAEAYYGGKYAQNSFGFDGYSIGKLDTSLRYIKCLCDAGFNIVADRLHLTEYVYGSIDRQGWVDAKAVSVIDSMIDEIFGDDVALVLMHAEGDFEGAQKRSGVNQRRHAQLFDDRFAASKIKRKLTASYHYIPQAVEAIAGYAFKYDLYFASPFFRPDQVEREERLKDHLRDLGFKVFSPKEACHLSPDASIDAQQETFDANIKAIRQSAGVFAITDGKDMGTIWEAGYAFGLGKPIIYFAETLGNNQFNLMLAKSGRAVLKEQDDINAYRIRKALYEGVTKVYMGVIE